jgi:hypothetical protein
MHHLRENVMIQGKAFVRNYRTYSVSPVKCHIKVLLEDLNATAGRENTFKLEVQNESLHK